MRVAIEFDVCPEDLEDPADAQDPRKVAEAYWETIGRWQREGYRPVIAVYVDRVPVQVDLEDPEPVIQR